MLVSRVITIDLPSIRADHTAIRIECARLWNRMVKLHHWFRKRRRLWPTETQFKVHFKGRFELHSQTVQGLIERFFANIDTARTNRTNGLKARYPHKLKRFVTPVWKPQAVELRGSTLVLAMGQRPKTPSTKGRRKIRSRREPLRIPIPRLPVGAISKVELGFRQLFITLNSDVAAPMPGTRSGAIDLGVIHLGVVTDGVETLAVVGRGLRSEAQLHNKSKAELISLRSRCVKGSRRSKKLGRSLGKLRRRRDNVQKNLLHHAANAIRGFAKLHDLGTLYVGDITEMNRGKKHKRSKRLNQDVGNAPWGQFTGYLSYKLEAVGCAVAVKSEAYTSQTCPVCSARTKVRGRVYVCRACRFTCARDAVGSWNFLNKCVNGTILPGALVPNNRVTYLRPVVSRLVRPKRSVVVPLTPGAPQGGGGLLAMTQATEHGDLTIARTPRVDRAAA